MSRGINKVILIGTLGRDPEVRYAANGNAIANLSVATSEQWNDRNTGERQERTEWHRVVIFGKLAEIAGQYLRKGSQVYLEGRLQTRKWTDQNGQDRWTTEVVIDQRGTMQMLDRRNTGDTAFENGQPAQRGFGAQPQSSPAAVPTQTQQQPAIGGSQPQSSTQQQPAWSSPAATDFDDDDVPF